MQPSLLVKDPDFEYDIQNECTIDANLLRCAAITRDGKMSPSSQKRAPLNGAPYHSIHLAVTSRKATDVTSTFKKLTPLLSLVHHASEEKGVLPPRPLSVPRVVSLAVVAPPRSRHRTCCTAAYAEPRALRDTLSSHDSRRTSRLSSPRRKTLKELRQPNPRNAHCACTRCHFNITFEHHEIFVRHHQARWRPKSRVSGKTGSFFRRA